MTVKDNDLTGDDIVGSLELDVNDILQGKYTNFRFFNIYGSPLNKKGTYFDKMIYVFDEQDENSPDYVNVLENDIITVYGTFEGMEETKNVLNGEKSKDVALHMKYAKLVSEGE